MGFVLDPATRTGSLLVDWSFFCHFMKAGDAKCSLCHDSPTLFVKDCCKWDPLTIFAKPRVPAILFLCPLRCVKMVVIPHEILLGLLLNGTTRHDTVVIVKHGLC